MRVLWFTNNSSVGANYLDSKGIGCAWIVSLEAELSKITNVQLGISFTCNQPDVSEFTVGNTKYFPVKIEPIKNKFKKIFARFTHKIEDENIIQLYLNIIQQFKPDIVHIFGTEHNFGLIVPKTTVPCIIHLQGNLTVNSLKWFSGLTAPDIVKYSKKTQLLRGHGLYHDYFINKKASDREIRIFKGCKYFMGRTDWDRRLSSVLSPDSKYFHCDEMMRPGFYLNNWEQNNERSYFVIVSTIRNNIFKGLETILECKKLLNLNFLKYNIIWKIAGIKEMDEISVLVERKCKSKFKDYNIQLVGPLQENDLITEMLNADIYVHPSHIENSSNSICEAMLLGMSVIATYAGGTPSIITDKKEGLLIQDGDYYALAGAIIELLSDREFASTIGTNARIRSLVRNEPKRIINDVINIYTSILSER